VSLSLVCRYGLCFRFHPTTTSSLTEASTRVSLSATLLKTDAIDGRSHGVPCLRLCSFVHVKHCLKMSTARETLNPTTPAPTCETTSETSKTVMSGTNPDSRPLPDGWITQYDDKCVHGPSNPARAQLTCQPDLSTAVTKLGRKFTPLLICKREMLIISFPSGTTSIQRPIRPPLPGFIRWGPLRQLRAPPNLIHLTSSLRICQ
jgi:hypothetical protein